MVLPEEIYSLTKNLLGRLKSGEYTFRVKTGILSSRDIYVSIQKRGKTIIRISSYPAGKEITKTIMDKKEWEYTIHLGKNSIACLLEVVF